MRFINPDVHKFTELVQACSGGPVPFVLSLPNDLLTPLAVYTNLQAANRYAFILESVETGSNLGRYSFMGAAPARFYGCKNAEFFVCDAAGNELSRMPCHDPLHALRKQLEPLQAKWPDSLQLPPLTGGVVGFLGYDCVRYFEPIGAEHQDLLDMPEMLWMLPETIVCFDHLHSQILLMRCVMPEQLAGSVSIPQLYEQLLADARQFASAYLQPTELHQPSIDEVLQGVTPAAQAQSNFSIEEYKQIIGKAKEHIVAGDVFQIVPSQRFTLPLKCPALDVYRSLRKLNPSSYMFALKLDKHELVGSSPETQLRCQKRQLMMRPIAGTRQRTGDMEQDLQLAQELLADEKELAEHRMLVDLVRNDLGSVAAIGSVEIQRLLQVEQYSHVMHITSEVTAQLAQDKDVYDALRATFPAGTLTGAPKVRAMQLINQLETFQRNVYGGLVGYIDLSGNSDSCIAIRMMMASDGQAHVQAGGGVVADSEAKAEYQETVNKATAVLQAIAEAQARS